MSKRRLATFVSLAFAVCWTATTADELLGANAALQYWQAFAHMPDFSKLTEAEQDLLYDPHKGRIDEKAEDLLRRGRTALKYLHRGARAPRCDWGLGMEEGPLVTRIHWQKARELSMLARLRARQLFDQKKNEEAWNDLFAIMTLARHVGQEPLFIDKLVEMALEATAVDDACARLLLEPQARLRDLSERYRRLPASCNLAEAARTEKRIVLKWFEEAALTKTDDVYKFFRAQRQLMMLDSKPTKPGKDTPFRRLGLEALEMLSLDDLTEKLKEQQEEQALLDAVTRLATDEATRSRIAGEAAALWDELVQLMTLPVPEYETVSKRFAGKLAATEPMARALAPYSDYRLRLAAAKSEAQRALFGAALAIAADGPGRLKSFKDPFGDSPFLYRKTENGFELESALKHPAGPVKLTVGRRPQTAGDSDKVK